MLGQIQLIERLNTTQTGISFMQLMPKTARRLKRTTGTIEKCILNTSEVTALCEKYTMIYLQHCQTI